MRPPASSPPSADVTDSPWATGGDTGGVAENDAHAPVRDSPRDRSPSCGRTPTSCGPPLRWASAPCAPSSWSHLPGMTVSVGLGLAGIPHLQAPERWEPPGVIGVDLFPRGARRLPLRRPAVDSADAQRGGRGRRLSARHPSGMGFGLGWTRRVLREFAPSGPVQWAMEWMRGVAIVPYHWRGDGRTASAKAAKLFEQVRSTHRRSYRRSCPTAGRRPSSLPPNKPSRSPTRLGLGQAEAAIEPVPHLPMTGGEPLRAESEPRAWTALGRHSDYGVTGPGEFRDTTAPEPGPPSRRAPSGSARSPGACACSWNRARPRRAPAPP